MKTLKIKWQRLVLKGQTCPRCRNTGKALEKAVSTLKVSLASLGIKVIFEKYELSVATFKKAPLSSNQIQINGRSLEDWVGGRTGKSKCCDVCGPNDCRTTRIKGRTYESIPVKLLLRAALLAAAELKGE